MVRKDRILDARDDAGKIIPIPLPRRVSSDRDHRDRA
jgi:hypothetical protein